MKRFLRLLLLYLLAQLARPFARRPPAGVSRVLYIKPDHLGDLLLATPVLAALRRSLPNAQITALVGPWSEMTLRRNQDVDVLLTCPFPGFERGMKDEGRRTKDERRLLSRPLSSFVFRLSSLLRPYLTLLHYALLLRAQCYDAAIVGRDDHWWGAALALLAGVPLRFGFALPECRPFLTTALPFDPRAHVTEQGLALVEAVIRGPWSVVRINGQQTTDYRLWTDVSQFSARFDPSPGDMAWVEDWRRAQGLVGARMVVLHPGTAGPDKLWFPDRWAQVADALQADGTRLVLTGGPGEQALVAEIAMRMRTSALTLAGETSVGQLAALLRQAELVLGVDSGPLHLAAAQGVRTVHLYGPGDHGRFGPWGDPLRHVVVREALWCSPCGVFSACPRGLERPECMELITVAQVVDAARRVLASG
jgi:ADP-heptose:LPS heptosyltransferase